MSVSEQHVHTMLPCKLAPPCVKMRVTLLVAVALTQANSEHPHESFIRR